MFRGIFFCAIVCLLWITSTDAFSKHGSYSKHSKSSSSSLCDIPGFVCIRVKGNQSWQSLFPDRTDRGIVMRINRTNTELYPGKILQVPVDLIYNNLLAYSPFPRSIQTLGEKVIVFDPKKHAWGAYTEAGQLVRWGPATGGKDWCEDVDSECKTESGIFRIYSVGNSDCVSTKFPVPEGGAPMPYCMYFNGGQALHGSPGGVLKGNASHGCVRLFVQDAEWLRYDFVEPPMAYNHYRGTKVVVLPYQ